MSWKRTYRTFNYREAVFRICCEKYATITVEIVRQRYILEDYIIHHPEFRRSLEPLELLDGAPEVAQRMACAARLVGVGPMAAVAGVMAELAGRAGLDAGVSEVIVDNGGDIYICAVKPVIIGLKTGTADLGEKLAFSLQPGDTPISICSSSGRMGHSMSLGECDLATVVAKDAALADAAATKAANLVKTVEDIDPAIESISTIEGINGVMIVKGARVGMAGNLPPLVKIK